MKNNFNSLSSLLEPKSIAIVGASDNPERIGGRPLKYMLEREFSGVIYPINPNRETVQGVKAYADINSLPVCPDVAIVALESTKVPDAIKQLKEIGVKNAVIFSSGFAEVGAEGNRLQDEILEIAGDMRLLGPNSLGLYNAKSNFWGTFTTSLETCWPLPGRVGIASQSGAYGAHMLSAANKHGVGVSVFIATGNEIDITVSESIGWMVDNKDIDIIIAYMEGVRDGPELVAVLEHAKAARKPVIMLKAGRSELGSEAAKSHTAALAGDDAVIDAVFNEFGVIRVNSTEEALDVAKIACQGIYPKNNTMGVLTVSGGAGIIVSDEAEQNDIELPIIPDDAQARMKDMLSFASTRNPVDCTAQVLNEMDLTGNFGIEMVQSGCHDSMLIYFGHAGGVPSIAPGLRAQFRRIREANPDVLYVLSILASDDVVSQYEADGFVVFEDPSRAVRAIAAMNKLGKVFASDDAVVSPDDNIEVALPLKTPNEAESKQLLAQAGISIVKEQACETPDEAVKVAEQVGYPVVLKILSADLPHKTEVGGVLLNVASEQEVREGFELLFARAKSAAPTAKLDGVLVSQQIKGGVECILGIQNDPVFGHVALFGLGGIYVEILKDAVLHRCPFNAEQAHQMIRGIKGFPLLQGVRGQNSVDLDALAEMLSKLSHFAAKAGPKLKSVDLNPVIATPEGVWAVDAVVEIAER